MRICKNPECEAEHDEQEVERIYGSESKPFLLGYCSATCYILS